MGFTEETLRNLLKRHGWIIEDLRMVKVDEIPSLKGKILTELTPSFLQNRIFCVASKE